MLFYLLASAYEPPEILKRIATEAEIAAAVLFVASDQAERQPSSMAVSFHSRAFGPKPSPVITRNVSSTCA